MDLTGDNVLEFRSLSAQESAARELRGRAGWIELDVLASKTDRAAPAGAEEAMPIPPAAAAGRGGAEPAGVSGAVAERERPKGEGAGEGEEWPDPARAGAARGRRD